MNVVRRVLIRVLTPLLALIGSKLRRRRRLDQGAYTRVRDRVIPGDVILTRRRGLVAWLIPGYWSHAAIVTTLDMIVHAVYPRVEKRELADLVHDNDSVIVMRPLFADSTQRINASVEALGQAGKPYDLGFGPSKEAFYCSELVWYSYKKAVPSWDFEARTRLGVETVTPQDIRDADKHFSATHLEGSDG